MGFEGRRRPPEFIIKAAMAESPDQHKRYSSKGGNRTKTVKAEQKRIAEERIKADEARIAEEREIHDELHRDIVVRDAFKHSKQLSVPEDD
jgi:hypothetical protein